MLPFLKNKHEASVSVPAESIERKHDNPEQFDEMEAVAEDILNALKTSDKKLLADALRSAFELMDSEPHIEGEHLNKEIE